MKCDPAQSQEEDRTNWLQQTIRLRIKSYLIIQALFGAPCWSGVCVNLTKDQLVPTLPWSIKSKTNWFEMEIKSSESQREWRVDHTRSGSRPWDQPIKCFGLRAHSWLTIMIDTLTLFLQRCRRVNSEARTWRRSVRPWASFCSSLLWSSGSSCVACSGGRQTGRRSEKWPCFEAL